MAPLDAHGREEIDATGAIVAPGIVESTPITIRRLLSILCDDVLLPRRDHGGGGQLRLFRAPCRHEDVQSSRTSSPASRTWTGRARRCALGPVRDFSEFLESLKGNLGVNFACYAAIPTCAAG